MSDPYEREAAKAAIKVLQRELAEARKERDAYKVNMEVARETCDILQDEIAESEKMRKQLAYAHVFAVERAQQYEDQRDALVEALEMVATHTYVDGQCDNGYSPQYVAKQALAAVEGGSHE
jgi:chromosome segregation ATPase